MNTPHSKKFLRKVAPGQLNTPQSYIAYAAGKSGGHIVPCLTLAREYKAAHPTAHTLFFTADGALDHTIISQSSDVDQHIPLALENLPRSIWSWPVYACRLIGAWWNSLNILSQYRPTAIITTGGIIAMPVCCAAYILRIPVHLYPLDAVPGKAIYALSKIATKIYSCFDTIPQALPNNTVEHVAYPIRYSAQELSQTPHAARLILGLDPDRLTIAVLGGSQGSVFINQIMGQWIQKYAHLKDKIQIIHQLGNNNIDEWHRLYSQHAIRAHVFGYKPNLADVYAAADIIIARAGAGTIFEAEAFGKPTLLIPLEASTTDHQIDNAQAITKKYPHLFTMMRQPIIEKDPDLFHVTLASMLDCT